MNNNLKHFENYFKNREEVKEYFKNKTFIFDFICDNTVYYVNTIPEFIEDDYVNYMISFYYELGESFFLHETIDNLDKLQISEVRITSESTSEQVVMYFSKYVSPSDN